MESFSIRSISKTITWMNKNLSHYQREVTGLVRNGVFVFMDHRIIIPYYRGDRPCYLTGRRTRESASGKYKGLYNPAGNLPRKRLFNENILLTLPPKAY